MDGRGCKTRVGALEMNHSVSGLKENVSMDGTIFAKMLKNNQSITTLDLGGNKLKNTGCSLITRAISHD